MAPMEMLVAESERIKEEYKVNVMAEGKEGRKMLSGFSVK